MGGVMVGRAGEVHVEDGKGGGRLERSRNTRRCWRKGNWAGRGERKNAGEEVPRKGANRWDKGVAIGILF